MGRSSAARFPTTLVSLSVSGITVGFPPNGIEGKRSRKPTQVGQHAPPRVTSRSYDALKVRFSATVGEEPEVELAIA
jgi:hypothetical protein